MLSLGGNIALLSSRIVIRGDIRGDISSNATSSISIGEVPHIASIRIPHISLPHIRYG